MAKPHDELRAELRDAWHAAKAERDAAIEAAWEIADVEDRVAAVEAAKNAWSTRKAELLERQAQLPPVE